MKQILILTLITTMLSTAYGQTITKSDGQYYINNHILHKQGLYSLLDNHQVAHYPFSMYKEKKKSAIIWGIGSVGVTLSGLALMVPNQNDGIIDEIFESGMGMMMTGFGMLGGIISLSKIRSCNDSLKSAIRVYNEDATTFIRDHRSMEDYQIALGTTGNGLGLLVRF